MQNGHAIPRKQSVFLETVEVDRCFILVGGQGAWPGPHVGALQHQSETHLGFRPWAGKGQVGLELTVILLLDGVPVWQVQGILRRLADIPDHAAQHARAQMIRQAGEIDQVRVLIEPTLIESGNGGGIHQR